MVYNRLYEVGKTGEKCSKTCGRKAEIIAGYILARMQIAPPARLTLGMLVATFVSIESVVRHRKMMQLQPSEPM
jgi:hypothetical protein